MPQGIRLVRNLNVGHDQLRWEETARVTPEIAHQFTRFNLNEGDIVISLDRPLITTGLKVARINRDDLPCLLLQRVGRVVFKHDDVLPDYFFLWLHSPAFIATIDAGRSNGVPHISAREIEAIPFSAPPLAEQRRIVEKVDQLLWLCDELAARQAAQREKRQRLVGATLDRLVSCHRAGNANRIGKLNREGEAPAEPRSTGDAHPRQTAECQSLTTLLLSCSMLTA